MRIEVDPAALARAPAPVSDDGDHGTPQERLAWIFRTWLRAGHVHPLLHLIHQYRGGQRQ
jgi:hypothetical protein